MTDKNTPDSPEVSVEPPQVQEAIPPLSPDDQLRSKIETLNETVNALRKALESERKITKALRESEKDPSENRENFSLLEKQLSTLQEQFDLDRTRFKDEASASKRKIEELKNFSKQKEIELAEAHKALTVSRIKYEFSTAARDAKIKAPYVDLIFASSSDSFQFSDEGKIIAPGGLSLDEYLASLRETMPEIFSAPSLTGTGSSSTKPPESNGHSSVISRDSFLDNLDAIISGDAIVG